MAQQTAVEWLDRWFRDNPEATYEEGSKALKQAKQMEKEQIIKAHCHNRCLNDKSYECSIKAFENSEQYFNEIYGENKD